MYGEEIDNIGFDYPASILLLGPSRSGKSTFIAKSILEWPTICPSKPNLKKVIIYYDQWQPLYRKLRDEAPCEIIFIQDTPTDDNLVLENLEDAEAQLIVCDDLQDRLSKRNIMKKLFTVISHHGNTAVMFACQDLLDGNDILRSIRKNASYVVLMASVYETGNTLEVLQRAYFSRHKNFLQSVCDHVTKRHGADYLIIVNTTPRLISGMFRLVCGIFQGEELCLYSPK